MISAEYYPLTYLIIVILGTLSCILRYSKYPSYRVLQCEYPERSLLTRGLLVAIILFIGFRPIHYIFVDTMNYYYFYSKKFGAIFLFDTDVRNLIFDNLMMMMSSLEINISWFFLLIATIYFGCIFIALKEIFPHDVVYAFFVYLGAFSTFSYATNGIKAGAAASIFLLAFAFYDRKKIAILFCLLSMCFHHSMFFPVTAYWLVRIIPNTKYYYIGWVVCLILAAAHVTYFQFLFAGVSEAANEYLGTTDLSDSGMKTGFRIDFILYGIFPIIIGYWVLFVRKIEIDNLYRLLLNTYVLTNAVWMLTMYAPFNNRIAYLSWCLLPIVSIYPFLKINIAANQYSLLNYVVTIYLLFEIFAFFYL